MSTEMLVRIPFDYDDSEEEKSSEHKDNTPCSLDELFSPSETYHNNLSIAPMTSALVRIVSANECCRLKANIIRVLKDNNYDILDEFNVLQFIIILSKILPSSPHEEITKLFNLLCCKSSNLLSFESILNNDANLNIFLDSMGCVIGEQSAKRSSFCNKHRGYDVNKPLLSWRSNHSRADSNCNDMSISNWNYMEYIEYQRDVIETLRNEITDIYKPLVLQNKEMQINMESSAKQTKHLKLERDAMQNEIQLLEKELIQMRNDYDALNIDRAQNDDNIQILQRRISSSYAEIQESHEFLEGEILELQQNLQQTRRQSSKRNDDNDKLQEVNDKYITMNAELRSNLYAIKEELNEEKENAMKQNEDMNGLKYALFERDQRIAILQLSLDDLSQQLQFLSGNNYVYKRSKRHKRSCSGNHLSIAMEFDIFNDIVVSPKSVQYEIQMEGIDDDFTKRYLEPKEDEIYNCNILKIEDGINNNQYTSTRNFAKEIGTQTETRGFWERLLIQFSNEIRCVNP